MARIRTIKPETPQSASMGKVSRDARLTFILLFTLSDDHGRLRGSSRMLASLLYPYDDGSEGHPSTTSADLDGWLDELEREKCIQRYKHGGADYIQITNWLIHQKVDKPSKSKIPPPPDSSRNVENIREASSEDQRIRGSEDQDQRTGIISPIGEAAVAASSGDEDLKGRIFGTALDWLAGRTGKSKDRLRALAGKWCSQHGDAATLEAINEAAKQAPLDPVPYIEKVLSKGKAAPVSAEYLQPDQSLDPWMAQFRQRFDAPTFNSWFAKCTVEEVGEVHTLKAPTLFMANYINNNHRGRLIEIFGEPFQIDHARPNRAAAPTGAAA